LKNNKPQRKTQAHANLRKNRLHERGNSTKPHTPQTEETGRPKHKGNKHTRPKRDIASSKPPATENTPETHTNKTLQADNTPHATQNKASKTTKIHCAKIRRPHSPRTTVDKMYYRRAAVGEKTGMVINARCSTRNQHLLKILESSTFSPKDAEKIHKLDQSTDDKDERVHQTDRSNY